MCRKHQECDGIISSLGDLPGFGGERNCSFHHFLPVLSRNVGRKGAIFPYKPVGRAHFLTFRNILAVLHIPSQSRRFCSKPALNQETLRTDGTDKTGEKGAETDGINSPDKPWGAYKPGDNPLFRTLSSVLNTRRFLSRKSSLPTDSFGKAGINREE